MAKAGGDEKNRATEALTVEEVRRILDGTDYDVTREKVERASAAFAALKSLLVRSPILKNGKLSTGNIDYTAWRVETLSLIFEVAKQSFRKYSKSIDVAHEGFLSDLGDEVGLTFAWDLMNRLDEHKLILPFQDVHGILNLWASFENDTGAGETEIASYTPDLIRVRLKKNPLRRMETIAHAHCGFYSSYISSLVTEINSIRSRYFRNNVSGAERTTGQCVVGVVEEPDAKDECVFVLSCRPEKLAHSLDLLVAGYAQFYGLPAEGDYSACVTKARAALVTAQMEAVGLLDQRAPRGLYLIYRGLLSNDILRLMDDAYHRTSNLIHAEGGSLRKVSRRQAWRLLLDVRRCVHGLELLVLSEAQKATLRASAMKAETLTIIDEMAAKAKSLPVEDRQQLKDALATIRDGLDLSEDRQQALVRILKKLGKKVWDVAKPVLADVLGAAAKKQLGLE